MREFKIKVSILGTIYTSDDCQNEEIEDAINSYLIEKGIDRDGVNNIEFEEVT